MASKPKPWIAEGISRRTWERRLKTMSQGVVPTILTKVVPDLASPSSVESQRGYHDGVLVEKHQLEAMESEKMDTMHQARLDW